MEFNKIILQSIVKILLVFLLVIQQTNSKELLIEGGYVVKKGDTLWGIAEKHLKNPWKWREIWQANPEIKNPHLIYPGDKLIFETVNGQERIRLVRNNGTQERVLTDGTVKLTPRVRQLPADKAIPTIPLKVIGPFLNDWRVITEDDVRHSGKIVALDEDHLVVGQGDRIYIQSQMPYQPQKTYLVVRPQKPYKHPKTGESLGIEGELLGRASLEHIGNPSSFILNKSYAEIKIGDRILESLAEPVSPYFFPKQPKGDPEGQIVAVHGGLNQIGQYQVVVITGGNDQSREVGDVLSVFQKQKDLPTRLTAQRKQKKQEEVDFPALTVGKLILFRIFENVSYALVLNATRPIYLLDEVGKP